MGNPPQLEASCLLSSSFFRGSCEFLLTNSSDLNYCTDANVRILHFRQSVLCSVYILAIYVLGFFMHGDVVINIAGSSAAMVYLFSLNFGS